MTTGDVRPNPSNRGVSSHPPVEPSPVNKSGEALRRASMGSEDWELSPVKSISLEELRKLYPDTAAGPDRPRRSFLDNRDMDQGIEGVAQR